MSGLSSWMFSFLLISVRESVVTSIWKCVYVGWKYVRWDIPTDCTCSCLPNANTKSSGQAITWKKTKKKWIFQKERFLRFHCFCISAYYYVVIHARGQVVNMNQRYKQTALLQKDRWRRDSPSARPSVVRISAPPWDNQKKCINVSK